MRIDRISLQGVTRYTDPVELPLAELGEGLIALVGGNGAGKTTLLEAAFAGLHREYPTRPGPLHQVCHGKEAGIRVWLDNGRPYMTTVMVDAVLKTPKCEAYLFNGDGSPVTDGKTSTFDEAIEAAFGSPRLMLSAALSCQSRRGAFLSLSKAERKDLLAEILDTGGLQALCEAARARAAACETELTQIRARLDTAREEAQRLEESAVVLDVLRHQRGEAETAVQQLETRLEEVREQYRDLQAREGKLRDLRDEEARLQQESTRLSAERRQVEGRLRDLDDELSRAEGRHSHTIQEAKAEADQLETYEAAALELERLREQRRQLSDQAEQYREQLTQCQAALDAMDGTLPMQADRLASGLARAEEDASMLPTVPCRGEGQFAGCEFLGQATGARQRIPDLKQQLADLQAPVRALANAQADLDSARQPVTMTEIELKNSLTREGQIEPVARRLDGARAAGQRIADADEALAEAQTSITARRLEYQDQLKDLVIRHEEATQALQRVRDELGHGQAITTAMAELKSDGERLKTDRDRQQTTLQAIAAEIGKAEAQEERRKALIERLSTLSSGLGKIEQDLSDWRLLERAFGRDGIQALEIDAAGPELSELTNDLLHSCFGPRFDIRFVTQVPKRSGGGMKEVFDVQVIDHERGREGSVESLSGGEKTIISEAISLALAIYVGRHSGHKFETLFRDETAGALDPENADRYIAMLRRARQIAGAFQIVFIAQQLAVWEQADAVVRVQDGRVEIAA